VSSPIRVIHCLNQFFGGLGGEEKAAQEPILAAGAKGPGILLQKLCPDLQVLATVIIGDNYLAQNPEAATREVLALLAPLFEGAEAERPRLLVAGPAFNAGRYGIACGAICTSVQDHFRIPAVTAMAPQNPAVDQYRKEVIIARAGDDVKTMAEDLQRMAAVGLKLVQEEELLPEEDQYLPQGRRRNYFCSLTGAQRAVSMLLAKISGKPFITEYRMPVYERVEPAPAIADLTKARLALVTSGGIVPRGNPDRIAAASAQGFGTYPIKGLNALSSQTHETAHGGYDPTFANADPNRVLPLDVVRDLVDEGAVNTLHEYYYATVGNATSVTNAEKFGREIAKVLLADGVQAVILTST